MIQNNEPLAEDIRSLNVTRKEISLLTGVSYNTISHWLNGFSSLTIVNRARLSDAVLVYRNKMTRKTYEKKHDRITHTTI